MSKQFTRRDFLGIGASVAAGSLLLGCSGTGDYYKPPLLDQAPDGPELKAGLVGCGGRGTGAALNFLDAGPSLRVTALGDVFQDRLDSCKSHIEEQKQVTIAEENCFAGFDAFQRVIDSDVDIVLFATPPHFRPQHFDAAVEAGKHVFIEKPVAVDPVGARSIMATARKAENLGLQVSVGTQYRHQRDFVATYEQVQRGAIGDILAISTFYNTGALWYREPQDEWSEMEYMIRDWVNWAWLSGDHIVEQFIHNLDTVNWFMGGHPVKAVGFGGRHRRKTGDQFDFFSIDYEFENGVHMNAMTRQMNGTARDVSHTVTGAKGVTNLRNTILSHDRDVRWQYEYPDNVQQVPWGAGTGDVAVSPYVQEHIDMITNIRRNDTLVEAVEAAESTLTAIMGRISAYTGKEITWEEMMNSTLKLGPEEYAWGDVNIEKSVPVPGTD